MSSSFIDFAKTSLNGLQDSLTLDLKADAINAGWPIQIVNTLSVVVDGLTIIINYDDNYAAEIEDLEYGTEHESPKSIFRTFIDKHGDEIQSQVAEWSINFLVDNDILL
jgi:hypothetical protein